MLKRIPLFALVALIALSGCASLESPFDGQRGRLSEEATAPLDGRYSLEGAPAILAGLDNGIGVVCPTDSYNRKTSWSGSTATVALQVRNDDKQLTASVFQQDSLIAERTYSGEINENGFFEVNRQTKVCIEPLLLLVLGWVSVVKKAYIGVDGEGNLLLGTARGSAGRILLVLGLAAYETTYTHTYTRVQEQP